MHRLTSFLPFCHITLVSIVVSTVLVLAACGGTVVEEDEGGRGNGDGGSGNGAGNGNGNGNGSSSSRAANANAGTAGPGGVGGADTGPSTGQSSQGAAGSGCLYVEQTEEHCYKHSTCTDDDYVRETECEETKEQPGKCWCFIDGQFVAECQQDEGYCNVGANGDCCARVWPY
jgi:hypothetical protein